MLQRAGATPLQELRQAIPQPVDPIIRVRTDLLCGITLRQEPDREHWHE